MIQTEMTKFLVTGGAGFLGSRIVEILLKDGKQVSIIDMLNSETTSEEEKLTSLRVLQEMAQSIPGASLSFHRADLLDASTTLDILEAERAECIVHCASLAMDRRSVEAAEEFLINNVLGTVRLLGCLSTLRVYSGLAPHFVFVSSRSAVGETATPGGQITEGSLLRPGNPYGASKASVEAFLHSFYCTDGNDVTICRMAPMYGGPRGRRDMFPRRLLEAIPEGLTVELYGTGSGIRDWLAVSDGAAGIVSAAYTGNGYRIYQFGNGIGISALSLLAICEDVVGKKAVVQFVDLPAGDAIYGGLLDCSKAKADLNWEPSITDLRQGLINMYESMVRQDDELGLSDRRMDSFSSP